MSKVLVEESNLTAIASAIRQKLGVQTTYKPGQMAAAIGTIHGEPVLETLTANANGSYTPSTGKDGFSAVTVNVPNSYAAGDEGKVVSSGALVAQTARSSTITQNGTYDTTLNNEVTVNVAGGGSDTAELFTLTNESIVTSVLGQCVKQGKNVSCSLNVRFSSTSSSRVKIFTIPSGYRPAGYYYGFCGYGGNLNSYPKWSIYPDGSIYISAIPGNYLYITLKWTVPEQTVSVVAEPIITSMIGDIAINKNCAELSAIMVLQSGSNAWADLFAIPVAVAPTTDIRPYVKAGTQDTSSTEMVGYYRDAGYNTSTRKISQWRSVDSYDRYIYIYASWIIGE